MSRTIKTKFKSITIREDQYQYLQTHPELNFSGLVQQFLDKYIHNPGEAINFVLTSVINHDLSYPSSVQSQH